MHRRQFLLSASAVAGTGLAGLPAARAAETAVKEIRIGYQKTGVFLIVKATGVLEKHFAPQGIAVSWAEFTFGPPLLEALNAGALDYGYTGDLPPIFAQAARANLYYAAAIPARGYGQGVIVLPGSQIKTLADLRGRKVGVAKGSSGHNLLVAALETANLTPSDIDLQYLAPPDAAAAFSRGAIDAWSIWDPFFAIAELSAHGARALPIPLPAQIQNSYFLSNKGFTDAHPELVRAINAQIDSATHWADAHRDQVAQLYAAASGVELAAQQRSVERAEFTFSPLTDKIIAEQQAVADRFYKLGVIPRRVQVRDIVWAPKPAAT